MSPRFPGTDVYLATPQALALFAVLFLVGGGIGLLASSFLPAASAQSAGAVAAPSQPIVAVDDAPRDNCVPAALPMRAAQTLVVGVPEVVSPTDPQALEVLSLGVGGVFINEGNAVDAEQVR